MTLDLSGCAAILALVLSCYSTWKTVKFNRKQEELIESQRQLNALLADKESTERAEAKRANPGAAFSRVGSGNYRLKIYNQGPAVARNVMISFPEGNELVSQRDVDEKFPLETLERYQSVELIASVHMSSPSKLTVRIDWIDGDGESKTKMVHPTR
ncbi:hypothetical protein LJ656_32655 [Paraburkholderia sp. MMS20-SJTR3]|uniref:Uncharacterized protein n=1 Tax=Paraburkholderia sejongensis TaxID=2886946 RepID=A0ABS8K589_9BURK|nr:hypothetical protein [Paraburkholderia sp. MMS20-SJTR3]MCC8397328.1 hypothetical protein [Paraburkholderia sp. MMS20-SJTR3]